MYRYRIKSIFFPFSFNSWLFFCLNLFCNRLRVKIWSFLIIFILKFFFLSVQFLNDQQQCLPYLRNRFFFFLFFILNVYRLDCGQFMGQVYCKNSSPIVLQNGLPTFLGYQCMQGRNQNFNLEYLYWRSHNFSYLTISKVIYVYFTFLFYKILNINSFILTFNTIK